MKEKPVSVIYKTNNFEPSNVAAGYLSVNVDYTVSIYAVDEKSFTLWSGLFDEVQIPNELYVAAELLYGRAFNQVKFDSTSPLWGVWAP